MKNKIIIFLMFIFISCSYASDYTLNGSGYDEITLNASGAGRVVRLPSNWVDGTMLTFGSVNGNSFDIYLAHMDNTQFYSNSFIHSYYCTMLHTDVGYFTWDGPDVVISFTYTPIVSTHNFTLTIDGQSQTYQLPQGQNVTLECSVPNKTFTSWTVSGLTLNLPVTTNANSFTMPNNDCSATANFTSSPSGHILTVVGGSGSGTYPANTQVSIAYTGTKTFKEWSPHDRVAAYTSASASLNMPEYDYTVTAIESDSGGTGSGHVIVDNFSELGGIVASPIVSAISSLGSGISSNFSSLSSTISSSFNSLTDMLATNFSALDQHMQNGMNAIKDKVNDLNNNMVDGFTGIGGKLDTTNEKLDQSNQNLTTIDSDLNSMHSDVMDGLHSISDHLSDIKEDTGGIKQDTGKLVEGVDKVNDNLDKIYTAITKPTKGVSSTTGEVPSSDLDGSKYDTPSDAFSINKLDSVNGKIHAKFDSLFDLHLHSPNNVVLIIPFSQIPYSQYHHMQDVFVNFFENPLFMPYIAMVREIFLCVLYASTAYAIIRIVRTWET